MRLTRPRPAEAAKSKLPSVSPTPTPRTIASDQPADPDARPTEHDDADHERGGRDPKDERRPPWIRRAGGVHRREVEPEADRGQQREPDARRKPLSALLVLLRCEDDADDRAPDPGELNGARPVAGRDSEDHRHDRGGACDRRDDGHRSRRHPAVVGVQAERSRDRRRNRPEHAPVVWPVASRCNDDAEHDHSAELRPEHHAQRAERRVPATDRRNRRLPTRGSRQGRVTAQQSTPITRRGAWRRSSRAGSRGRAPPPPPCVRRACRDARRRSGAARLSVPPSQPRRERLDQAQAEMHVAEQAALVGRRERRPAGELERPADIVDERGREHELAAQSRMELRRLAAERGDADRVLEQPTCVGVMGVRCRRVGGEIALGEHRAHGRCEALVRQTRRRGTRGNPAAPRRLGGRSA